MDIHGVLFLACY